MRTFKLWPIAAACIAAYAMPLSASAQQAQPAPKDTPPKLEVVDESAEPAITIRKQDSEHNKVTETRKQGKVTDVKVQSGKSTYHLKPNEQAGSALPGDTLSSSTKPPQWKVLEFDTKRKKQPQETDTAQVPPPPEPPAASAPAK